MQVRTPARRTGIRLAGAVALATVLALGVVAAQDLAGRSAQPRAGAIVHAPSPAYVDFAHRAFDRFRDAPPEQDFNAASEARSDRSPI
ncbi:MAG: hypothetical protein ACT6XY_14760 [Phreatobacter sp.]|jgi:hypothetical protein|uniref:hypothetical protein n=1 Tax=Phreatobacter sp. TaxID=1966341 RepID=UPI0040376C0C